MEAFRDVYLGSNVTALSSDERCRIHQIRNDTGEGVMTCFEVMDGVYLMYNDFHMRECQSELVAKANVFCIDHCREGRIEHAVGTNGYSYLAAGDLRIDSRGYHTNQYVFPLEHYHGITIAFFLGTAERALAETFKDFPVHLEQLQKKYCRSSEPFIVRGERAIDHLFSELYTVPEKIKDSYYKIKVFELLLFLDALELPKNPKTAPYFYKSQVEKVKAIHELMVNDLERHYTLNDLAERFRIALTPMKTCFKGVYGSSIFAYMRTFRMNRAAVLLRKTQQSIAEIALQVGYSSPSKFSSAFKDVMKMTPLQYRKTFV